MYTSSCFGAINARLKKARAIIRMQVHVKSCEKKKIWIQSRYGQVKQNT